ncbi:MAG: hypothetical protein AUF65_02310 [Chloroflexi bacterium 13_1_20CM_50_12]|nr:MAG: hypothetical protein AUF65_02310 [Chloroflexi bacterium 13_1_20CM_50_12]
MDNEKRKVSSVGHWIKLARERRGWTQEELAEEIGVSPKSIGRWERGETEPKGYPRHKLFSVFCEFLEDLGPIPLSNDASVQMQDGAYFSGSVTNQGWMNIVGGGVGSVSLESRENVTKTNLHSDRGHMLLRLESSYHDELATSFEGIDRMELGLAALPQAFWNDAPTVPQYDFLAERSPPSGTSITQIYETARRELLLVGEAGAGKSTLLFILGQYLVDKAKEDTTHPIPFILSLSTWAIKRLAIEDWASEQLVQDYHVAQELSQKWFQQEEILLLLDGLDEVEAEARPACISAINRYYRKQLRPLVVCSRTAAYAAAAIRERLYLHPVMVQLLTFKQVNKVLDRAGESFAPLKKVFNEQAILQEVIKTPLMLRFLLTIDPKTILQELSQANVQEISQQATRLKSLIIEYYIQRQSRQLEDPRMSSSYTTQQIQSGLIFLAKKMCDHKQTTFYLEHLQSNWLPTERLSTFYNQLATRGIGFLLGSLMGLSINAVIFGGDLISFDILYALLGGLIGGLISGGDTPGFRFSSIVSTLKYQWRRLVPLGLLNAFLVGLGVYLAFVLYPSGGYHKELIYGYGIGVCSFFLTLAILGGKMPATQDAQGISSSTFVQRLWNRVLPQGLKTDHCKLGIVTGLLIGLSIGISVGLSSELSNGYGKSVGLSSGISNGLSTGLTIGLSYTAVGIMLCLSLFGKKATIKAADMISWSLKSFGRQFIDKKHLSITSRLFLFILCFFGFGIGIGIGLSTGWSAGITNGLTFGLSAALSVSSAYWILFALWTGVSSKTIDDDLRAMPNQGIRRSFQISFQIFFYGSILCILIGLFNEILYYGLVHGSSRGVYEGLKALLRDGLFIECFGALLPALFMGGITVLRHYLLRFLLWYTGVLPIHTVRFLDDVISRDLLHRDGRGGGYRFSHGHIFDYFAGQELTYCRKWYCQLGNGVRECARRVS